jgi:hypothetical protein
VTLAVHGTFVNQFQSIWCTSSHPERQYNRYFQQQAQVWKLFFEMFVTVHGQFLLRISGPTLRIKAGGAALHNENRFPCLPSFPHSVTANWRQ